MIYNDSSLLEERYASLKRCVCVYMCVYIYTYIYIHASSPVAHGQRGPGQDALREMNPCVPFHGGASFPVPAHSGSRKTTLVNRPAGTQTSVPTLSR